MTRKSLFLALGALAAVVAALSLWPSSGSHAGYPLARRVAGSAGDPLWQLGPDALERVMTDDALRLERTLARLDVAVRHARDEQALLGAARIEDLDAEGRKRVRDVWWSFLEPLLAIDAMKARYEGWYGVDYLRHPGLHARAFGLAFAALCAQVDAGHALLELVADRALAQKLFDEAMPELGLPAQTFHELQDRLARSRDYSYVPLGAEWFGEWINPQLHNGPAGEKIATLVAARVVAAKRWARPSNLDALAKNKLDVLKDEVFARWFPLQKGVATWFGDTRVAAEDRRLVSDAQIAELGRKLQPGDIVLERRNWYLSNIGLPGFWPHAALWIGTQDDVRAAFDSDPETVARFGKLSERLARERPAAWAALARPDASGHPSGVLEAVSEGVVVSSLQHSCGADYVAALRPRIPRWALAQAIDRALSYFGRPYDFDFDFATDDAVVCSELVVKAFEPGAPDAPGLRVPYVTVAGRRAIPPTEIVRAFAAERGRETRQLDFVHFLDGREGQRRAMVADESALAASAERPKWDVLQP